MNDREMIFSLGNALEDAVTTINQLALTLNTIRRTGCLPEAAGAPIESLICNCAKAAKSGTEMASIAKEYGGRPLRLSLVGLEFKPLLESESKEDV